MSLITQIEPVGQLQMVYLGLSAGRNYRKVFRFFFPGSSLALKIQIRLPRLPRFRRSDDEKIGFGVTLLGQNCFGIFDL